MEITTEEYRVLFNTVTDAISVLESLRMNLILAQQKNRRDGKQTFSGKTLQIAANCSHMNTAFTTILHLSNEVKSAHNQALLQIAVNHGKLRHFILMIQIMFICYPDICRGCMDEKVQKFCEKGEERNRLAKSWQGGFS